MRSKFCAALSAILCAALLGGCSLFESEPANIYVPAGAVITSNPPPASSSTDGFQYEPIITPSSSSSTQSSSSVSAPTETPTAEPLNLIDNYRRKWYYNTLSYKRKQIYKRLYECALNNNEECDVSDLIVTQQDVYVAYWAFDYENPQFLTLGSGYEITFVDSRVSNKVKTVKILYGRTADEIEQTLFESRAEDVLEAARALDSDYERLKYIHDWIVNNTVYTNTGAVTESEADSVIIYGEALCEGYSKTFMYLAQSLGYQCICSVGVANLEKHMWNMVKIGGAWFNVDVTWDDPKNSDGTQTLRHDYFLINDAQIRLDHRVERPVMLPNAPKGYFPYGYDIDGNENSAANNSVVQ